MVRVPPSFGCVTAVKMLEWRDRMPSTFLDGRGPDPTVIDAREGLGEAGSGAGSSALQDFP